MPGRSGLATASSAIHNAQQVTINAAWQIGEDKEKGSIEPGKRADLVVLDGDPLSIDPADLYRLRVVATIKDGKAVRIWLDAS